MTRLCFPAIRAASILAVLLAVLAAWARADSPDAAEAIIFSSNRSGPWRIWSINPNGSALRMLTGAKEAGANDGQARQAEHDVDPAFSPNGKSILFSSTRGGTVGVWRMAADGTSPERICDGDQADWSPDGLCIVFRRNEKLLTRVLASGAEKPISPADWPHPSGPAWSPDGQWIAFACRWDAGNGIFRVLADGGKPEKVIDRQGACEPRWSPDGARLLYETETNLATIRPDGTRNRPVTWFGGIQRYGQYSPDGKSIVFCQGPSERGPWELYRIAAGGGTPIKITTGGSDMNPDWK